MDAELRVVVPPEVLVAIEARVKESVLAAIPPREWPAWLSDKTAADYASCSVSTIKSWRRQGLPYRIVNGLIRIRRVDLDAWLESHPKGGSPLKI
jgi:hypothetical protein